MTGDKDSTAKYIGYSCGILNEKRNVQQFDYIDEENIDEIILLMSRLDNTDFLISGYTITTMVKTIRGNKVMMRQLLNCLLKTKGIIIYRASSSQKAELIKFIQAIDKKSTTLAIGDGINDVNMLQTAHIGVGIQGKEGTQASACADVSIGQFKHLRRLLFWHGSSFGSSLTSYIILDMSRMMLFAAIIIFYSFLNGFSCTDFVQDFLLAYYSWSSYGFYTILENNVNNHDHSEDESTLPYKMSQNYQHHRDKHIKKLIKKFAIFSVFVYMGGMAMTYITFFAL